MGQKKTIIQTGTWSPSWGYSLEASASMAQYPTTDNKRIGTEYPNGRSSITSNGNDSTTNVSEASAFATKYPTNANRTNKGTTYGYPSTGDTTRFVRTKTNVTDIAAYVAKYPNNTTKAGWVDGVSPKNQ
jgi:hypothetical protein